MPPPPKSKKINFGSSIKSKRIKEFSNLLSWDRSQYMAASSLMCWDAVKFCAYKVGAIKKHRYDALDGRNLVTREDCKLPSKDKLYYLEAGDVLGFYPEDSDVPMHMMVYLGNNMAAGNKNSCIGLGNDVGWEELNLSLLNWQNDGSFIPPPGMSGKRKVFIFYKQVTALSHL